MLHLNTLVVITIVITLGACAPTCSDNLPETAFKATVLSTTPNKLIALNEEQRIQISLADSTKIINDVALTSLVNKEIWVRGVILSPNQIQAHELRLLNALN